MFISPAQAAKFTEDKNVKFLGKKLLKYNLYTYTYKIRES